MVDCTTWHVQHGLFDANFKGGVVLDDAVEHVLWLLCPACREHPHYIRLNTDPTRGHPLWTLEGDDTAPTIIPSIWLPRTCGVHFYVRAGQTIWC